MDKVYLASPLFTISEQFWNEVIADEVRKEGYNVFNPQSDNDANDKENPNKEISAKTIYEGDYKEVLNANIIIANLDGLSIDSGLAAEIGAFSMLMERNPDYYKGIIGFRSDIRKNGEGDQRFYFNQYVIGLINNYGYVVDLDVPYDKLNIDSYRLEVKKIIEKMKLL